jgi:hypothetical protein
MTQDQATSMALPRPVTQYELCGEGVKILVSAETEDKLAVEYNGTIFQGPALQREQGVLGRTLSVVVEVIPDLHTIFLSVIVPEANQSAEGKSVPISTFAVFTTGRSSIGGPALLPGQLQLYKVVPLEGSAL